MTITSSHEGRIGEEEMKRQLEYFDYSVILGLVLWRKDHAYNQKTRTEGNGFILKKKSRTKTRRRHKKEQLDYLKEHEQKVIDLVKHKIQS